MKVIALNGVRGCGKNWFADRACETTYVPVKQVAFADPIRHVFMSMMNIESQAQYDTVKRMKISIELDGHNINICGRTVLRELGMSLRALDEDQFTRYVENTITSDPNTVWVITDLRFENELALVRRLGGITVKIKRPGFENDGHITERGFTDDVFDHIIENDGTINQYTQKVYKFMEDYFQQFSLGDKQ